MCDLHGYFSTVVLRVNKVRYASPALYLRIIPQPRIARRNPSHGTDRRSLGDNQSRAARSQRSQVDQVPVVRDSRRVIRVA